MFLKLLGLFISLVWVVHCNKGKADLERCGCVNQGNRSHYLVEARADRDQLASLLAFVIDMREQGGAGSYDRLEVDGVCAELDTNRVFFCAEDKRDYLVLEDEFPNVTFREELVN